MSEQLYRIRPIEWFFDPEKTVIWSACRRFQVFETASRKHRLHDQQNSYVVGVFDTQQEAFAKASLIRESALMHILQPVTITAIDRSAESV